MSHVHSVNRNGNGNAAAKEALAEKLAAAKEAAAAKQAAAKEATTSTTSASAKSDTVQISEQATTLAGTAKADTASSATASKDTATQANQSAAKVEEATQNVSSTEKATPATTSEPQDIRDVIKEKRAELRQVINDLKEVGTSKREIRTALKTANKKANASVVGDLKQAYTDYKAKNIDRSELKDRLYGAVAKKLDGVVKGMKNVLDKKMAFINGNNGSDQAPRESILTKASNAPTTSAPSEKSNQVAQTEEKTAMVAEPAITEKATPPGLAKAGGDDDDDDDDKKVAPGLVKKAEEALPPGQAAKSEGALPPGQAAKAEGALPPGQAAKAEGALPPGQAAKAEGTLPPGLSKMERMLKEILTEIENELEMSSGLEKKDGLPGNSGNASEKIASMFNEIDKMVNDLDKEVDGAEAKKGFGEFVSGLSEMFSSGGKTKGNSFLRDLHKVVDEHGASDANKVGKATIQAETLGSLLKGGSTNSSYGINRVGDGGDGSGDFSAVNFMSDMSNNVGNGLDMYSDAKEARSSAGENGEKEANEAIGANGAKQASPESQFSAVV